MKFKGTQGKWKVSDRNEGYVDTENGDMLVSVYADTDTPLQEYSEENKKEVFYNTKLIAYAPALLEILEEVCENLSFQLDRLRCCGEGDGSDHKADNDSYGGNELLIRAKKLIKEATEI